MSDDDDFDLPEDDMPVTKAVPSVRPSAQPSVLISEGQEQPSNVSPEEVKSALEDLAPTALPEPPQVETISIPIPEVSPTKTVRSSQSPLKGKANLPLMNAVTVNRDTYDLDKLLSPHVQRKAETLDRFSAAHLEVGKSLPRSSAATDFVKQNRESAGRRSQEKSTMSRRKSAEDLYNVDERFYSYQRGVEAKVRMMEEEKTRQEKANCTFSPAILAKHQSANPRSADLFYEEMMRHEQRVQAKVKALRDQSFQAQQSQEDSFFRPKLCEKSMEMVKKDPNLPAHEKLYQTHKQRLQRQMRSDSMGDISVSVDSEATQDSAKPFTPAINKKSLTIVRDQPFEVYLSEDAKRRAKRLNGLPVGKFPPPVPSSNSLLLLIKRFREEFSQAWTTLDEDSTSTLTYSKTADLLKQLHFIENQSGSKEYETERTMIRSIWKVLRLADEAVASKDNVETVLLAVMNFPGKETPVPIEGEGNKSDHTSETATSTFGRVESGVLLLNPGDTLRIHLHFKSLYDHRANIVQRSSKNPSFKAPVEHSYRPQISKASQRLTEDRKTQLAAQGFNKHEDFLVAEAARREQALKEKKAKAEKAVMKECTFQPKIDKNAKKKIGTVTDRVKDNIAKEYIGMVQYSLEPKTDLLYQFANVTRQRRNTLAKSAQEREMERNEIECTFVPDRSLTADYDLEHDDVFALPAKGVDKAVARLAKGRRQSVELAMIREKGMPFSSSWMSLHSLHYEDTPEEPASVLAVQVNGRAAELRVRAGDNLDSLINVFLAQHRLSGAEAEDIRTQLTAQFSQISGSS